jgi:hypothetical protein
MSSSSVALSAEQAQDFVEQFNNQFGMGALPEVRILTADDGSWMIQWADAEEHHKPMNAEQWQSWLEARFGPGLAERLETSEG